jgi:hypothetical protein
MEKWFGKMEDFIGRHRIEDLNKQVAYLSL